MTKNSAHKKAARAYQAKNPGTVLPEALRATERPPAGAPDREAPGDKGSAGHVWNFNNPKLAALVQTLAGGGGLPAAMAEAGFTVPPATQDIGGPISLPAARPGDIVVTAGGARAVMLGIDDGQMMVLTESGVVVRITD